ncbi:MAG: MoaD/ThiS family protein [Actinobacteria bacterium]|jgi:molybdopterin synthase sulfur carrier subunit|nr:MoaD/ThiS family protein [Actinomycetota bacterium]
MAILKMFGPAREAAGRGSIELIGATVGEILSVACDQFGEQFRAVLSSSTIWVNGERAGDDSRVHDGDEIAVLPPVSGGL